MEEDSEASSADTELSQSVHRLLTCGYLKEETSDEGSKVLVLQTPKEGLKLVENIKPPKLSKKQKKAMEREKKKTMEKERKLKHTDIRVAQNWKLR